MERIPTRPRDEFLMAIAGPAVSLLIGSLCLWGGAYLPMSPFMYDLNYVEWLGVANLTLFFFNLIPAFPMDGGRILRSALTPKFGRLRATLIAVRLGKAFAVLFALLGLYEHAWMLVLIAFFIFMSAGNEYRYVQMQEAARRQGFGAWSPFDTPTILNGDDDDQVTIGPPPYGKGPGTKTEIHPADDDHPFRNIFGR
jgi:stage IV sporulation protein FB